MNQNIKILLVQITEVIHPEPRGVFEELQDAIDWLAECESWTPEQVEVFEETVDGAVTEPSGVDIRFTSPFDEKTEYWFVDVLVDPRT